MAALLGMFIGLSMWYGLFCFILRTKKTKKFILAGLVTWVFCVILDSLFRGDGEHFWLYFINNIIPYLLGVSIWTGLAIYFDKTNKNIKWILKYIPLGSLVAMLVLFLIILPILRSAAKSEKQLIAQDDIAVMVAGTRALLSGYDDYSKIDNATIFGAMGISNKNPYNGTYRIDAYEQNKKFFVISMDNIPSSDCRYFLKHKWTDSVLYRLDNTQYNGALATPEDCSETYNTVQIIYD